MTKQNLSQNFGLHFKNQSMQLAILTDYHVNQINQYRKAFDEIPHPFLTKFLPNYEEKET